MSPLCVGPFAVGRPGPALLVTLVLLVAACGPTPPPPIEVTREIAVEVTRVVTREIPIEVTREIAVEVTRLIPTTPTPSGATPEIGATPTTPATEAPPPPPPPVVEAPLQPRCWSWQEAGARVGASGCVEGVVSGTGESGSAFFINFDPGRESFYAVAFDWRWENLAGRCLRLEGIISEYRGRPQMVIDEPARQLVDCTGEPVAVLAR